MLLIKLHSDAELYLIRVYHISDGVSAIFGIFNTAAVGILAGLVSGFLADYVFKSSTTMMAVALGAVTLASGIVFLLPNNPYDSSMGEQHS